MEPARGRWPDPRRACALPVGSALAIAVLVPRRLLTSRRSPGFSAVPAVKQWARNEVVCETAINPAPGRARLPAGSGGASGSSMWLRAQHLPQLRPPRSCAAALLPAAVAVARGAPRCVQESPPSPAALQRGGPGGEGAAGAAGGWVHTCGGAAGAGGAGGRTASFGGLGGGVGVLLREDLSAERLWWLHFVKRIRYLLKQCLHRNYKRAANCSRTRCAAGLEQTRALRLSVGAGARRRPRRRWWCECRLVCRWAGTRRRSPGRPHGGTALPSPRRRSLLGAAPSPLGSSVCKRRLGKFLCERAAAGFSALCFRGASWSRAALWRVAAAGSFRTWFLPLLARCAGARPGAAAPGSGRAPALQRPRCSHSGGQAWEPPKTGFPFF